MGQYLRSVPETMRKDVIRVLCVIFVPVVLIALLSQQSTVLEGAGSSAWSTSFESNTFFERNSFSLLFSLFPPTGEQTSSPRLQLQKARVFVPTRLDPVPDEVCVDKMTLFEEFDGTSFGLRSYVIVEEEPLCLELSQPILAERQLSNGGVILNLVSSESDLSNAIYLGYDSIVVI